MTLPSKDVGKARRRLPEIGALLDAIYLITDESPATEFPSGAVTVDPLFASAEANIGSEDAISATVGKSYDHILYPLAEWTVF